MVGKRQWYPDEEPETEFIEHEHWLDAVKGLCGFCGNEGHTRIKCPNRPLPKSGA